MPRKHIVRSLYTLGFLTAIAVFYLIFHEVPRHSYHHQLVSEHTFILQNQNISAQSDKIISDYSRILQGLDYKKLIKLTPAFIQRDRQRIMSTPFPTYAFPPSPTPKNLPTKQIHFMQNTAHTLFHNNKYDVITDARLFKQHKLSFKTTPIIRVWQDTTGVIWSLDHRRLASILLAGNIKTIPVKWATEKEVLANKKEYTTRTQGRSIIIYLTRNLGLVIEK